MKTKIAYWSCQVLGWGAYSAMGLSMATRQMGWQFHIAAGYVLFTLYSIALTDLLQRGMKRRGVLDHLTLGVGLKLFAAALGVAAVQAFLVSAVDLAFEGAAGFVLREPKFPLSIWMSAGGANCIWLLFYVALSAPHRYREKEVRLELALREAELRALEAQVHPHFLFNCLNSIRALVVENPAVAQDMLTRFANILRYNLNRHVQHTVPLAAEMEVVSDYLALEAVRLEDRLRVRLAIDGDARNMPIPPMLLQTLVENALKHGIAPLPGGGELAIGARVENDALAIEVTNAGELQPEDPGGTKVGLKNTRERLRLLYGDRASLELANRNGGVAATVLIPRTV